MKHSTCKSARAAGAEVADIKVAKTFRLAPGTLAAAQRILGAKNITETIETALDMVVFRKELLDGTRAMLGVHLTPPDDAAP